MAAPPLPRHRPPPRPARRRSEPRPTREKGEARPEPHGGGLPAAGPPRSTRERPGPAASGPAASPPRSVPPRRPPAPAAPRPPGPRTYLRAAPPPRTPTVAAAPPAERLTFKSSRFAAKFPPLGKFWGPIQGPGVGSRGEADGLGGRRANSAAPTRRRGKGEGEGEEGAGSLGGVIPSDPSLPALAARRDLSADFPPPRRWRLWLSPSRHHRQCLRLWALGSGYFQFCSTTYKRVISGNLPLFAK